MEINLTDLEFQALAMTCWLKERFAPKKASEFDPGLRTLLKLGFVEEIPDGEPSSFPLYTIRVTGRGLKWFRNLDPIIKIRAYIRCSLYFEAKALIIRELPPEQLPEFLVHGDKFVREAAQLSVGIYRCTQETST